MAAILVEKLLGDDAVGKAVALVVENRKSDIAILFHRHERDVADFEIIRGRAYRPLVRIQDSKSTLAL